MHDLPIHLLIVDDDPRDADSVQALLATNERSFRVTVAPCLDKARDVLSSDPVDALLIDLMLSDAEGLDVFRQLYRQFPNLPIILLTTLLDEGIAITAMREGAQDYLIKGEFDSNLLRRTIRYAMERHRLYQKLQQQNQYLQSGDRELRTIIHNSTDGILIVDYSGYIQFANPAAEALFGLAANALVGQLFSYPLLFGEILEVEVQRTSGQTSIAELRLAEVTWEREPAYLASLRDITEHKQIQAILQQQAEHEREQRGLTQLFARIARRIRRSLDLEDILNTTVAEVRHVLRTDRVVICCFNSDCSAVVTTEAVGKNWRSILRETIHDPCFKRSIDAYRQGHVRAIADIHMAKLDPCHINLLSRFQVRANLVVPILQGDQLWGLLIAHHCVGPRQWHSLEIDLLSQLADQLSIAIQQSELYRQVRQLNASLEQQVHERTTELQLALDYEATLKRITDKVRDSLDEDQILQTAVRELAVAIDGVSGCNASVYDLGDGVSTVTYEYTIASWSFRGQQMKLADFADGYRLLLQNQYFQFCGLFPHPEQGRVAKLACPMADDQGVLGDLWLTREASQIFSEQDIRLVQQVANQCAIAIRQSRLYQAAQAQVKELERLNQLKDDFLSTVSHELRTPMASIKMAAQMLEVMLQRGLSLEHQSERINKYLKILKQECQREISLINDLLDLSRLEADAEPMMPTTQDLEFWLRQLATPFFERTHNQQQRLQILIAERLPPLTTDYSYLERVLTELLHNACKYTPAGEVITLSAAIQNNALCLAVSNSGVEIALKERDRIFDKFYRIPNNDPWKYGGTGLGLALVKKLVERLGGEIQLQSLKGQTTFTVMMGLGGLTPMNANVARAR